MFLIFFGLVYIIKLEKEQKFLYYIARMRRVSWERKLVPSSGTYLCSMQGSIFRMRTLRGMSPSGKGDQDAKYKREAFLG